jgi:uncharacterized protein YndB with AHSA1/START domain
MTVTHADFTIERRFDCTPQQTFAAFADPGLKRRWFAPPDEWTDTRWELDFRVGGAEVNSGRSPGGATFAFQSRFHDIVDNERIVFAYDLWQDTRLMSVSLTTVEFFPDAGGTRMLFTEQGAFFDELDSPAEREHGTGKLLEALERLLAGEPVR